MIDRSGSMKKNNQIKEVKKSIKKILLNYEKGSTLYIYGFDSDVDLLKVKTINTNEDLQEIFDLIDSVEANGNWTNLLGALDSSLDTVKKIKKEDPDNNSILVLYTDGLHDLPPSHKNYKKVDFEHLFKKYYENFDPHKPSWFIYYVELGELDPKLSKFLKETKSGKVVTKDEFRARKDFLTQTQKAKLKHYLRILALLIALYVLIRIILYKFRPWFTNEQLVFTSHGGVWEGHPQKYELFAHRKTLLTSYLVCGRRGHIQIKGKDVKLWHFGIGMDLQGNIFVKPLGIFKRNLTIDGMPVRSKTLIFTGQKIKLGDDEFSISTSLR